MTDIDAETGEIIERLPFRRSRELGELFKAKAAAQPSIENATKDATNPAFRSTYASLGSVLEACLDALSKAGISVWQFPFNGENDMIGVSTLLGHVSGQWIETSLMVRPAKFDAPGVGSVITYLRRYALMAVAGMAPEDDDGNAAALARPEATVGSTSGRAGPVPIAKDDAARTARVAMFKRIRLAIAEAETVADLNRTGATAIANHGVMDDLKVYAPDGWQQLMNQDSVRRVQLALPDDPVDDIGRPTAGEMA